MQQDKINQDTLEAINEDSRLRDWCISAAKKEEWKYFECILREWNVVDVTLPNLDIPWIGNQLLTLPDWRETVEKDCNWDTSACLTFIRENVKIISTSARSAHDFSVLLQSGILQSMHEIEFRAANVDWRFVGEKFFAEQKSRENENWPE